MTQVIVMGSCYDIHVNADQAATHAAVQEFLDSQPGNLKATCSSSDKVLVDLPYQGFVNSRGLAIKMNNHLIERFGDQSAVA